MSTRWTNGSPAGWRQLRAFVLERDGYRCQINLKDCTLVATQVHHRLGASRTGIVCHPDLLVSACARCNRAVGQPDNKHLEPRMLTQW